MKGSRVAIAIGTFCLLGGWGAGLWAVRSFLAGPIRFLGQGDPAPVIVRTDPRLIVPLRGDFERAQRAATKMSLKDVSDLRASVARNPGDVEARARLMAYGFSHDADLGGARLHNEEIVWFVANMPDAPMLAEPEATVDDTLQSATYDLVRRLYDEAIAKHPQSTAILSNAAAFDLTSDNDRAVTLLSRATSLKPRDARLYERLAFARTLAAHHAFGVDRAEASRAVDAYLRARELGGEADPKYLLRAAFDSKRYEVVERVSEEYLKAHDDADAMHAAHTALGRVALARGDVTEAKAQLLASAKVAASPVLGSFGPSMDLAKELLERGERQTVLAYLEATSRFWEDERQARWIEELKSGRTPDLE